MKSLSQSEYGELRDLYESIYMPAEELSEELFDDICDELICELIEEGYSEEDAILMIEDAANDYIDEAKVTFGSDTAPMRKSGAPVGARRRFAMRKAGDTVKKAGAVAKGAVSAAKSKAAGAAVDASLAASSAKKAVSGVASAVKSAPGKAAKAAARGTEKVEKKVKSGIKGLIGRAAKKVASKAASVAKRMSEEVEALKASGKFSEKEIAAILESENQVDEAMSSYDRNRKRAAQRAAARNAARDAGKTGAVPGVGYVSPRRERETYVDSAGTTRHKSGAKMPKD